MTMNLQEAPHFSLKLYFFLSPFFKLLGLHSIFWRSGEILRLEKGEGAVFETVTKPKKMSDGSSLMC